MSDHKLTVCVAVVLFASVSTNGLAAEPIKAVTVTGDALLQVPESMRDGVGKQFTVAKHTPRVHVAVMTGLPDKGKQTLWSTWGDGCVTRDGVYYTSIGDHMGRDGTSYVYRYDPKSKTLTLVLDVFKALKLNPGAYGHGKIHSGMHESADGSIWFSTYWGKHREVEAAFGPGYQGSVVMRMDPKTHAVENVGAIVPKQGLPASHFDPHRQLLYFYAVYKGDVTVYDVRKRKVVFHGGGELVAGNRTFMRDGDGRVYFSRTDGNLGFYDPKTNQLGATSAKLPSSGDGAARKSHTLRAAIQEPTGDGVLYAMTAPGRLFRFDARQGKVSDLGPNLADGIYTAAMVISPDERFLYYAPGAHGSGSRYGAPVVQYEIATGKRKVIAFLSDAIRKQVGWNTGGTYNTQISADGSTLFLTFNGAPVNTTKRSKTFGQPAVVVVHVPGSER